MWFDLIKNKNKRKNEMLYKPDIDARRCSGWDEVSENIKNAEIRVITKKLWPVEVSRQNRCGTAWRK